MKTKFTQILPQRSQRKPHQNSGHTAHVYPPVAPRDFRRRKGCDRTFEGWSCGSGFVDKSFWLSPVPKIAPKLWPEIFSQTSNTPPRSRRFSTAFINSGVGNRGGLEVAPLSGGFWLKAVCACHKQVNKLVKNPRGGPEVMSLNIKDHELDINWRYLFCSIIIFWK